MTRSLAGEIFFGDVSNSIQKFHYKLLHGHDDEAKKLLKLGKAKYFRAINHTNKNVVKSQ